MYGTPIKLPHDGQPPRSSYKFFENYNFKCLMNDMDPHDKENITSGNKATNKKTNSPMSHYKYIYKIIHTSTVLRQSPTSAKRQLTQKLCSIVSLDCIENLNSKFDSAETMNLNSNHRNVGFSEFIDHMREDSTYAGYFEDVKTVEVIESKKAQQETPAEQCKKRVYNNIVAKLMDLTN